MIPHHSRITLATEFLLPGHNPIDCDVLVIGGGASGSLMALHLLRQNAALRIAIVERSSLLGCGVAYSTQDPDHLLNTRVHNMSAYADEPDHFLHWLQGAGARPEATPDSFVGRPLYGAYLGQLLAQHRVAPASAEPTDKAFRPGITCLQGDCVDLVETQSGVTARLEDGTEVSAYRAVLATGHATPSEPAEGLTSAWDFTPPKSADESILIIGTGLSMVDHLMSLLRAGHRGKIVCVSRRGLLPREHRPGSALTIRPEEIPFGQPVSRVLHWLRKQAQKAEKMGGTWRDAVDGLRPFVAKLWQSWPLLERRRFLRHGASWWEVYRHRMPPRSASLLSKAAERGQFLVVKARFEGAELHGSQRHVRLRQAGGTIREQAFDKVIDCRGIRRDPVTDSGPVVRALLARGDARLDALNLGLDTTLEAQLVNTAGAASPRIYAIGPCARGALWEITAIPDIRLQCAAVASAIAARVDEDTLASLELTAQDS